MQSLRGSPVSLNFLIHCIMVVCILHGMYTQNSLTRVELQVGEEDDVEILDPPVMPAAAPLPDPESIMEPRYV